MLEISIEQRIIASLSTSLQSAFAQTREETERNRREFESLNGRLQLANETITAQAAEIQSMREQRLKDTVKTIVTEKVREILAVPATQCKEIVTDILQKARSIILQQEYIDPLHVYLDTLNSIKKTLPTITRWAWTDAATGGPIISGRYVAFYTINPVSSAWTHYSSHSWDEITYHQTIAAKEKTNKAADEEVKRIEEEYNKKGS